MTAKTLTADINLTLIGAIGLRDKGTCQHPEWKFHEVLGLGRNEDSRVLDDFAIMGEHAVLFDPYLLFHQLPFHLVDASYLHTVLRQIVQPLLSSQTRLVS